MRIRALIHHFLSLFLSYDTRSSSFRDGERWTADEYFGSRAFFRIMSDPPTLEVDGVQVADEAVYTCRVDYKVRPSSITKVNLTVIGEY